MDEREKIEELIRVYDDICSNTACDKCVLNIEVREDFDVCQALDKFKFKYNNNQIEVV